MFIKVTILPSLLRCAEKFDISLEKDRCNIFASINNLSIIVGLINYIFFHVLLIHIYSLYNNNNNNNFG